MEKIVSKVEKIPVWAISALIYGDYSGLEDEDIALIENWINETRYDVVCPPEQEDYYFTSRPAFGLACDVYDCECLIYEI